MESLQFFLLAALLIFCQFGHAFPNGGVDQANEDEREEVLDNNGKYTLAWTKDFETKTISFKVTVATTGFVGFGISPNGGMAGADIVIGGVYPNGTAYFTDRHATGNQEPLIDQTQDWTLLEATENATHTTLSFSRLFDTCDDQDFKIGNDTSALIWSFGETDTISYHSSNRGSYSVNLLDPAMPPYDPSSENIWRMAIDYEMPSTDTVYWCTIHKSPKLNTKHHMIGFEPYLPSDLSKAHTHHFIVHECRGEEGEDLSAILDPLMENRGHECFTPGNFSSIGRRYCQQYLYVWAIGGRRTIFPDHVGYPLGGGSAPEYYMLEIHFDNPAELKLPPFVTGIDIFYSDKLRQFDAGTLTIGHGLAYSHLLPPKVPEFLTVGHCSSECTSERIPAQGINVFNVLLHAHLTGRKLKLRHYRDGKELPWLSVDDKYDFDYQQNRPLREEVIILPGDQLAFECTYETMSRVNVTLGGLASQQEMCQTFIGYYPKGETQMCGSEFVEQDILPHFGIESVLTTIGEFDPIITAPPHWAGRRFSSVANEVDWTTELVAQLQKLLRFTPHRGLCSGRTSFPNHKTTYVNVSQEYEPPNPCQSV